jgi:hypothetical protein
MLLLNECLFLLMFMSLSTQSGNFWIYPLCTVGADANIKILGEFPFLLSSGLIVNNSNQFALNHSVFTEWIPSNHPVFGLPLPRPPVGVQAISCIIHLYHPSVSLCRYHRNIALSLYTSELNQRHKMS